jgi:organic hydroperoxide reductase OsmC/OhrA
MLSWLHVAFSHGAEVESYLDMAEGVLEKLSDEQSWISEIVLKPRVAFNARQQVEPSAIQHFHEMAHRDCFIAWLAPTACWPARIRSRQRANSGFDCGGGTEGKD